jgi:hypothetical protein
MFSFFPTCSLIYRISESLQDVGNDYCFLKETNIQYTLSVVTGIHVQGADLASIEACGGLNRTSPPTDMMLEA